MTTMERTGRPGTCARAGVAFIVLATFLLSCGDGGPPVSEQMVDLETHRLHIRQQGKESRPL